MKSPNPRRAAAFAAMGLLLGLLAFGCSKSTIHMLVPNQRPTVTITSAPANSADTAFYAYQIFWAGNDPDGQVDHFTYAIDPTDTDTLWQSTIKKNGTFFFRSGTPVMGGPVSQAIRSVAYHVFVIKAWDNLGLASAPQFRAFYSYTVAPTVYITDPLPIAALMEKLTPSTRITWTGTDPDGQFTQKPVKYKYKLLVQGNAEFDFNLARTKPDSLRKFYAKDGFASWDSVGGDTTTVQYTGLLPNQQYLFIVIGYDEAGAYSPVFTLTGNMLQFQVGFAGTLGPVITVWNESFTYTQAYGQWFPDVGTTWFPLEVPANKLVTFNWSATPPPGGLISYYRWRIGGDVLDETPRTNETTDWSHWSAKSSGTTSCVVGPFAPNVQQLLYVGAWDNNGLRSIVTIQIKPVLPTFQYDVLIVNDSRAEVDQYVGGRVQQYSGVWPAYAELDTFLFARGGVPWNGTQVLSSAPVQPVSKPGIFAGYAFDTIGTRQGYLIASAGVPLSLLGKYKHVVWIDDHYAGTYSSSPIDQRLPESTLHWMCTPSHQNTLGAYMVAGGSVWLAGGTGAFASLREFNATGAKNNDKLYGTGKTVFSNTAGELIPGRLMYDSAHWQNEMVYQAAGLNQTQIVRSPHTPSPWSMPGFNWIGTVNSPTYTDIPAQLHPLALSRGDSLPPTRTSAQSVQYFGITTYDLEYMTQDNYILEDISTDPNVVHQVSVLDTLMDVRGSGLALANPELVAMTYYHGVQRPDFIFSGFPLWLWTRPECIQLVDFVMQDIWHLPRNPVVRAPRAGILPLATPLRGTRLAAPTSVGMPLPSNRSANR